MNYPLFLARRLSLGSEGHKSAPAVKVAILSVALSVAVMLASIAVMKGFKHEIREKVRWFNSDMMVYPLEPDANGNSLVKMTPSLRRAIAEAPGVESYYLEAAIPGILKTDTDFKGVYYKGVDTTADLSFFRRHLEGGRLPDLAGAGFGDLTETILSRKTADQLGLAVGDTVNCYFISDDVKVRPLLISGIFNTHFEAYDNIYMYGGIGLVGSMADLKGDEGTTVHVMVDDFDRLSETARELQQQLQLDLASGRIYRSYGVETALVNGAAYFSWLQLIDTNVLVILALMTIVACVTMVSGMLIIILDKIRFIGVMRALGARASGVRRIFIYLSLKVMLTGMLAGNAVMLALLWLQERYHLLRLNPESYYIDFVPVQLHWTDILWLNGGVLAVTALILVLIPSRLASRLSPETTMRYE